MRSEFFGCELAYTKGGVADRNAPRALFEQDDEVVPPVFGPGGDGGERDLGEAFRGGADATGLEAHFLGRLY